MAVFISAMCRYASGKLPRSSPVSMLMSPEEDLDDWCALRFRQTALLHLPAYFVHGVYVPECARYRSVLRHPETYVGVVHITKPSLKRFFPVSSPEPDTSTTIVFLVKSDSLLLPASGLLGALSSQNPFAFSFLWLLSAPISTTFKVMFSPIVLLIG